MGKRITLQHTILYGGFFNTKIASHEQHHMYPSKKISYYIQKHLCDNCIHTESLIKIVSNLNAPLVITIFPSISELSRKSPDQVTIDKRDSIK